MMRTVQPAALRPRQLARGDGQAMAGLMARVTPMSARLRRALPELLNRAGQVEGNRGQGLDLVMLDHVQDPMDWISEAGRRAMTSFFPFFLQVHRGYRLRSMVVEAGIDHEPMALGAGYRLITHLDVAADDAVDLPPGVSRRRGVYGVTREDVAHMPPSSPIAAVFTYHRPRFRFTPAEQRVLAGAVEALTDDEIAQRPRVSHDAVEQTWRSIYDHVLTVMPDLVQRADADRAGQRGQEKRRRLTAYVRDNARELRPHYLRRG